jgi:hypothetical protein
MFPPKLEELNVECGVDVTVRVKPALCTSKDLAASQFLVQSTTVATCLARVFFTHYEDVLSHLLCRLDQDIPKICMTQTHHLTNGLGS